ncbi:MAG: rhodanese-like domain-containing protein [Candidatus Kapabacteria bacterium]|nr:rhodanese-like domain-containing protein [Ignavibacteriota bacterium]MCW5886005.1 rhodanese-like domain-containing protein [Candidatus Kapabacteria bacterium]
MHEEYNKSDLIIIDNRSKTEYDSGHIENAVLIPYNLISQELPKITKDKNAPIALYCRSGNRSSVALRTIREMGYVNAVNYGGISKATKILNEKKAVS